MTTATPPAASGASVLSPSGPGLLISFEGGDGVGKTTQIHILANPLTAADMNHVLTHEPGGTELGVEIRHLPLHGGRIAPRARALLYAASRTHHIATRVRPAPERSAVVLADCHLDSPVTYQSAARSLSPREVRDPPLWATRNLLPDLAILLGSDPDLTEQCITGHSAKNRLEQEGDALRTALREQFLTLTGGELERFVVIDANRPIDQVTDDVTGAVVAAARRHGARLTHGGAHQGMSLGLEAFAEAAARCGAAGPGAEARS